MKKSYSSLLKTPGGSQTSNLSVLESIWAVISAVTYRTQRVNLLAEVFLSTRLFIGGGVMDKKKKNDISFFFFCSSEYIP